MKLFILFAVLFGIGCAPVAKTSQNCLSYESSSVTLQGEISRKTFAGRPNFESIENGDEPETYWILHVSKPICINGDNNVPNGENADKSVFDIQLLLDEKQYSEYKDLLGKQIVLSGKLSHAISGHHHTAILLKVIEIKNG